MSERKSNPPSKGDLWVTVVSSLIVATAVGAITFIGTQARISAQIDGLSEDVHRIETTAASALADHKAEGHIGTERALGNLRTELATTREALQANVKGLEDIKARLEGIERALRRVR